MIEHILKFDASKLNTPNTYDTNFMPPPKSSGVYFIVLPKFTKTKIKHKILYVGSSYCLHERYKSHEVLRLLNEVYGYVQFYFKEIENYREVEKNTIRFYNPKFNTQWR